MNLYNLIAFVIVAAMIVVCAKMHMNDQQFNGVLQLGGTMVGVVGGVAVGVKMASRTVKEEKTEDRSDGGK